MNNNQQQQSLSIAQRLNLITWLEQIPLKNVFKNGKKLKGAILYKDKRGIYPDFIRDADNFFYCSIDGCSVFFANRKSVYQHYSSIHNKHDNPNQARKLKRLEKLANMPNKKIMEQNTSQVHLIDFSSTK